MSAKYQSERGAVPLAVLPGLMCDSRMFPGLAALDREVVFPDSFYPGASSLEAMAELALDALPARFALLGHSMGARVALEIWRRAPDRVSRLALVDTGTHGVREGERASRYALRDRGREAGFEALIDDWLPPMVAPGNRDNAQLMEQLRAMVRDAGQATFERHTEALLGRAASNDLLPTLTCPTFVIVGAEDQWSPVSQHAEIAAAIPHAQLRVVASAGHMLPAERPEEFVRIIEEWLAWQSPA